MKEKIISVLLLVSVILSLSSISVLAIDTADNNFTMDITADGSKKTSVYVGDEISVSLLLSSSKEIFSLFSMQDYICFDSEYLQFVEGSIEVYQGDITKYVQASAVKFSETGTSQYNRIFVNRYSSEAVETKSGQSIVTFKLKAIRIGETDLSNEKPEVFKTSGSLYPVQENGATVIISKKEQTDKDDGNDSKASGSVERKYTVTFFTNGGSNIPQVTKVYNSSIDLSSYIPTKKGYIFDGWYLDPEFQETVENLTLTKNVTVYAKWKDVSDYISLPFDDVKTNDWFFESVSYSYKNNLMNGIGNRIFDPNSPITRAMVVTMIYRLEEKPVVTATNIFPDIKSGMWYEKAVTWANEKGIVKGYEDRNFHPDAAITREELATILYRYEKSMNNISQDSLTYQLNMNDKDKISDWAYEAVCWMTMKGIIQGKPGLVFDPQGIATRAETATVFMRLSEIN